MQRFKDSIDFVSLLDLTDPFLNNQTNQLNEGDLTAESRELNVIDKVDTKEAEEELEYYEKGWNDSEAEQKNDETVEQNEEIRPDPVVEKPAQSIVPAVEASEKPIKRRQRARRKRTRSNKSPKSTSELDSRKVVKEQVNICKRNSLFKFPVLDSKPHP